MCTKFGELWPTNPWERGVINLGAHSAKVEVRARPPIRLACFAGTCQILVIIFLPTSTKPRAWKLSKNNGYYYYYYYYRSGISRKFFPPHPHVFKEPAEFPLEFSNDGSAQKLPIPDCGNTLTIYAFVLIVLVNDFSFLVIFSFSFILGHAVD